VAYTLGLPSTMTANNFRGLQAELRRGSRLTVQLLPMETGVRDGLIGQATEAGQAHKGRNAVRPAPTGVWGHQMVFPRSQLTY
jgi:hypothetical protein